MSIQRMIAIWLYALLHYAPHVLILVIPFRNRLRFPKRITAAVIMMGYVLQVHIEALSLYGVHHGIRMLIALVLAILLAVIGINDLPMKIVTRLLKISSIHCSTMIFSHYLVLRFAPAYINDRYHWTNLLVNLLMVSCVLLIFLPFMKKYQDVLNRDSVSWLWRFIWFLPMTSLMVWSCYFATSQRYISGQMEKPMVIFLLFLISAAFLVIYFVMLSMIQLYDDKQKLVRMERLHQKQFSELHDQILYARRARHDLRHHLAVINQYVANQDYDHLKDYLAEYTASVQDDHKLSYCDHYTINSLLVHFSTQCSYAGVDFKADCLIPGDLNIPTSDMIIVLGNLIENAFKAAKEVTNQKPFIAIKGIANDHSLVLSIVNPTDQLPRMNDKGQFLSTSHEGAGIGTDSVRAVVAKYNGTIEFTVVNHQFSVNIMMTIPQRKKPDEDLEVSSNE